MFAEIEAGGEVRFGPLSFGLKHVRYKNKELAWADVTKLTLISGARNGLEIHAGGLLPWCFYNLNESPNGLAGLELVRRLAPVRLLKQIKE